MNDPIETLRLEFNEELKRLSTLKELEPHRQRFLGRKGPIQHLLSSLRDLSAEERPLFGKRVNDLKEFAESACDELHARFLLGEEAARLKEEGIDVTLPGRPRLFGRKHPVSCMMEELLDIFMEMGFSVQYGSEIETDYYNFEALNFGPDHPARDMHDTFYLRPDILLRTHTSPTQVRVMEHQRPPIRVVAPGRCFRNEDVTARSHVQFHQIEGFYIDRGVSFADLLQTIQDFLEKLFGAEIKLRFRPSYFPFVEPGLEVDVSCLICHGVGCAVCKHSGWLEVLGAGMIHPEVLRNGGIDPEVYSGYAWGMGVERPVMLRHGIQDIRLFTDNDPRFLEQFLEL